MLFSKKIHLSFMSRTMTESRTPTKTVIESKSVLGLSVKVLVVDELQ